MLDSADILVYRHPIIRLHTVEDSILITRIGIAQEIPRRIHKSIHRICFSLRRSPTTRTRNIYPTFHLCQGRTFASKFHIFRQQYGQIRLRYGNGSAVGTVNHRNRSAPITLSRNQPISQAILNSRFAITGIFSILNNRCFAFN